MGTLIEGFAFIVSFLAGIIMLIVGLFHLVGGSGYVWYLAILYGLGSWLLAAFLLWVAWLAFNGEILREEE